jgi:hypothetical protein
MFSSSQGYSPFNTNTLSSTSPWDSMNPPTASHKDPAPASPRIGDQNVSRESIVEALMRQIQESESIDQTLMRDGIWGTKDTERRNTIMKKIRKYQTMLRSDLSKKPRVESAFEHYSDVKCRPLLESSMEIIEGNLKMLVRLKAGLLEDEDGDAVMSDV